MAKFEEWIKPPKRRYKRIFEGNNYQNLYNDAGNWTGGAVGVGAQIGSNMSISAPVLSEWLGREATLSDMQNMTIQTALDITKVKTWDGVKGDEITSQIIAEFLADNKSSAGGNGVKAVQRAANKTGANISVDGAVGRQTVNALNAIHNENKDFELYHNIRNEMISFYKSLNNPNFESGWLNGLDRDYPERNRNDEVFNKPSFTDNLTSKNNIKSSFIASSIILLLITILKRFS